MTGRLLTLATQQKHFISVCFINTNIQNNTMKNTVIILFLMLPCLQVFSQNLSYGIRGKYISPVKKETLMTAQTMSDIRQGYPSTWINDYISSEILVSNNGMEMKATGNNDLLNEEQKNILQTAEVGAEVTVDVHYKYQNSITGNMDVRNMHFVLTVVPEIEAEYPGGNTQLNKYIEQHAIHKISEKVLSEIKPAIIRFTISEKGEIENVQLTRSSENPGIDKLLLKTIQKMPRWKPAQNANGLPIKQEFEFNVGNVGC